MTLKQLLVDQFSACFNTRTWFVPLLDALEGLKLEQVVACNSKTSNSIDQIVNHLIFYNKRYLMRFKGETVTEIEGGNDATFEDAKLDSNQEWEAKVVELRAVMNQWLDALKEADDSTLKRSADEDSDYPWYSAITHISLHTAYHTGQIVDIRKQQGSWDPIKGVH